MAIQRIPITSFQRGEISEKFSGRFDLEMYTQGAAQLENWLPISQGGVTTRPGTYRVGSVRTSVSRTMLRAFVVDIATAFILEFSDEYLQMWHDGFLLFTIAAPYLEEELFEIQMCQIGNSLIMVHRNHPPWEITWLYGNTFSRAIFAFDGEAWAANKAYAEGDIVYFSNNLFYCLKSGTSGAAFPTPIVEDETIPITDGAVTWRWLENAPFRTAGNYPACITAFSGRLWLASTNNFPQRIWASKPFEYGNFQTFDVVSYTNRQYKESKNYYFQGTASGKTISGLLLDPRLYAEIGQYITGPTVNSVKAVPATAVILSMTKSSITVTSDSNLTAQGTQYFTASWWPDPTMPVSENVTTRNDIIGAGSGIMLDINSDQCNRITFLSASRALVIGTLSEEWVLPSSISAIDVQAQLQTRIGSAAQQGILLDSAVLFIQGDGKQVREYFYQADQESYKSPNLTYFSDHILGNGIVQIDFTQAPEPMLLCVTEDGVLAVLVYNKEYDTQAWCRYKSDGLIESVASIPGLEGDDIYIVVNRNGSRSIEYFAQPFSNYHVDEGITILKGSAKIVQGDTVLWSVNSVSGLTWLSGTVSISNGAVHAIGTVSAGTLALPAALQGLANGTEISIGRQFTALGKTMRLTTQGEFGIAQGFYKRFIRAMFRLYRSHPFIVGPVQPSELTITGPFTGDSTTLLSNGWETDGWITFTQSDPLETTILAIIAEVEA